MLTELGIKDDPLLDVAVELERIALHDDYFVEKKLYPNIDFYSGITLKAMGFPVVDVHRAVRPRPHRRLDRAVEGNDRGPEPEDRPSASALYRRAAARLCEDGLALILRIRNTAPRPRLARGGAGASVAALLWLSLGGGFAFTQANNVEEGGLVEKRGEPAPIDDKAFDCDAFKRLIGFAGDGFMAVRGATARRHATR